VPAFLRAFGAGAALRGDWVAPRDGCDATCADTSDSANVPAATPLPVRRTKSRRFIVFFDPRWSTA
jgi:hypothetical protein